jgi:sugar phosphate isomerase/epimerase
MSAANASERPSRRETKAMHPRVSLHQVAFLDGKTTTLEFIDACRKIGVGELTLVTNMLMAPGGMEGVQAALGDDLHVGTVNHPFSHSTPLDRAGDAQIAELMQAIEITATLGSRAIYVLSGGRGAFDWEQAATRFAELIAPCREAARAKGITLLVENASVLNADFHIAHNLRDVTKLAEMAGIGVCIDLHACWTEGGLEDLMRRAMPNTGLVQISDYVLGDRFTPCRAVPGDGVIPLERLIRSCLEAGYGGLFDLELVGPRIQKEGAFSASRRSAEALSGMLERLGA